MIEEIRFEYVITYEYVRIVLKYLNSYASQVHMLKRGHIHGTVDLSRPTTGPLPSAHIHS